MIISFSLILLGLISFFGYYISEVYVDENGILRESFILIPLGYIFCGLGILRILKKCIRKFLNYNFINLLQ